MKLLKTLLPALIALMAVPSAANAQGMNDNYDRNAISVIVLDHNDGYDRYSDAYLRSWNPGNKFDLNKISTLKFETNGRRFQVNESEGNLLDVQQDRWLTQWHSAVANGIIDNEVPKQVIGYWFNRKKSGMMDLSRVKDRASWNATDETYKVTTSQALGEYLFQKEGLNLIGSSYILVVDHGYPVKQYNKDYNGNITGVSWKADVFGWLFKVEFNDITKQQVYDAWIYDTDDANARKAKLEKWQKFSPTFSFVERVHTTSYASNTFTSGNRDEDTPLVRCIEGTTASIISKLENKVAAWQVQAGIFTVKPITSKIGTKEGLKNMDRYQVYEYVLDENGEISSRLKGWVRATTVVNNNMVARGDSKASTFYQIAGGGLEKGMLLHQKNSINMDVRAMYYMGASPGFGLGADYLFGMNDNGFVHHIRLDFIYGSYKEGYAASAYYTPLSQKMSAMDMIVGYGYGVRLLRLFELVPNAGVLMTSIWPTGLRIDGLSWMGFGAVAGADLNVTLWYPVKLTAGAYYNMPIFGGNNFAYYYGVLTNAGIVRQGLNLKFGVTVEF